MTTVAWWHPFSGIAGDMALASLVDAGADLDLVERELVGLPVGGWALEAEAVLRGGLAATQVHVRTRGGDSVVRTHAHIVGLITEARLPGRARDRALATFARLAEVEAALHRRPVSQVHFHEVGSLDAIIDVVGTCIALEVLGVDEVRCAAVAQGSGMVRSAHGLLPVPAPAVVALLRGAPTYGLEVAAELTTPTGAALVSTLAAGWGPLPAMEVTAVGYGAGSRELDGRPNAVQVVVGRAGGDADAPGHQVDLLETNLDDVTGEVLGHTVAAALAAGALDAWVAAVVGKKGRPAHVLSVLADPADADRLRRLVMAETGTLGVRRLRVERWVAARSSVVVDVEGRSVRVKQGPHGLKAEHDDAAAAAAALGRPLRDVARAAEAQAAAGAPSTAAAEPDDTST